MISELAATDMELSLRVPLEATVEQPGAVVLPRLAGDIVRTMADGPITLEHRANEGVVSLSGGGSSFTLNCLQASDFPELPADDGAGLRVPVEPLVEAIDRVARNHAPDDGHPVFGAVDAIGANEYFGWYDSYKADLVRPPTTLAELPGYLDELHAANPEMPLVITEFGAEASRPGPVEQPGSYEYQRKFVADHIAVHASKPYVYGSIHWALRDFRVDARRKKLRDKEVFDYIGIGWQIVPKALKVTPGTVSVNFLPDLQRVESRLALGSLKYERKEVRHPEKNVLQEVRFIYEPQTRGNVTVTADHEKALLGFRLVNTAGFEVVNAPWPAAKVTTEVLDEVAKRICSQPNRFA